MAADIHISKGLDIPMTGAPESRQRTLGSASLVSVYPSEYKGFKFKLLVQEGDVVSLGAALAHDKKNEAFRLCSPAAGQVKSIVYGDRRALMEIVIEVDPAGAAASFPTHTASSVLNASREDIQSLLNGSGLIALIKERPFNRIAKTGHLPKSIFVNAMNTAPFRPDAHVLIEGKGDALQAGLNALTRLSDGPVHLCVDAKRKCRADAITQAQNVSLAFFDGPHPSGNTSTHIHALDPILPGDVVWTLRVSDVLLIGELILSGRYPSTRTVMLAGDGVKADLRGYVTLPAGAPLSMLFDQVLADGEQRVIRGDTLYGETVDLSGGLRLADQGFVVLPEDRERHFLGWYAPTTEQFSDHKVVPSAWLKGKLFKFGTNRRGSLRAMVMTGIYDKYVPLDIMVDALTRACIAQDSTEAIALGVLETDPEDFALCTVICPSKTDFGQIVGEALAMIEQEGI